MTITKLISAIAVVTLLWSCDNKEKIQLQSKVDSLQVELESSKQTAATLQEVGVLLDSIDANRQLLRANMVEGTSVNDYKTRLNNVNSYVKETEAKIAELEKTAKKTSGYAGTIKRLRSELEASTQQLAVLQQEGERLRGENQALAQNVTQRDSLLNERGEYIKAKETDLANLETKVVQINEEAKTNQANLYFAQAQALETAAHRTKFAPRKKKDTIREAIELYKIALSLGKTEAQGKIEELEKAIG
jgi:chromosome segregation ATPase